MTEYYNMDSFGADCPLNWEEIAAYLNEAVENMGDGIFDEFGDLTLDGSVRVEALWEAYWAGDLPDAPKAQV